ncbi:cardiomyopathy-associated protein 5-like [Conger conger]|uniref:cardiomyopathy-associated protein 5-like n=1 Tax=Conger conger TaxID=82655 RepID=UPI002A5A9246|nr:cardiomyopathy-associated protein 5-like [Conger conger]
MIEPPTMDFSPEHCDRIDPDMPITVLQDESIGAGVVDDDDEIEGLRNSLKERVQDQAVKPKLQCVMMEPSFSMVAVQSEDSAILWETASSRCSSPWASDASTTSEAYSTQGPGTAGKIVFIMDEDKIIRRKKRTRGKLGEKCKRPPSRPDPTEQLKDVDERPALAEVSVPNVRPQGSAEEPTTPEEHKEQDLFSIVSEGSEILNIIVPSRLSTVDEEESSEMAENLSYLEQTDMVRLNPMSEKAETETDSNEMDVLGEAKESEGEQSSADKEPLEPDTSHCLPVHKPVKRGGTSDTDYFEKFTLLDESTPPDLSLGNMEIMPTNATEGEEATENQEQSASGDIAGDHLDEIFYGSGCTDGPEGEEKHVREEEEVPKSPLKESGSALFSSEEMILTPIFLSPGPPKIIDPSLLEEPRAMSFLYTDLYEEAVGDRKKGEDCSDVESTVSEKSLHRRLSDTDDASGYLEKFILKDETPVVEDEPTKGSNEEGGLRMLPESRVELIGVLAGVNEEAVEEKPEEIIENFLVPYEENDETETFKNTDLEDEMLQPPAVVEESKQIQQEAANNHEKSEDEHVEKVLVQETDKTENETIADNKVSESLMEKTTEKTESQEENLSKHVPSSNSVDTGPTDPVICTQESLLLDKVSKQEISQAVPEDTSESQLPQAISVRDSCPQQGSNNETGILKNTHEDIICEDDKEVQCALGSTAIHRPFADCDTISKTVKQKGEMLSLSPLLLAKTVQAEKEQELEEDSAEEEKVTSSTLEDVSEYCNDAFIAEPPEMYRDQDNGNVEDTTYEMTSQLEVCEPIEPETKAFNENTSGEQSEHGFDSVEVPTRDSPSKVAVEADNEFDEVLDETPLEEDKQENDPKMSRFRFCVVCQCIISSLNTPFDEHKGHDMSTLDKAYNDIKSKLSQWISVLQGRSEKIEDLVSKLEQAYSSLEGNCESSALSLDEQNEEMVKAVVEQYQEMSRSMAEKKRLRLGQLGSQIGRFQERIESARETLEREAREVERPDALALVSSSKDIHESLSRALESTLSPEPVLESYTTGTEGKEQKILKDILVPQEPYLLMQEASSATCTSITVFWRVSDGDVIDCFQVNCVEESHGEVYKVTVKESFCTLEELAPDRCYKVWVMALNYAGCSLPSEKLSFRTAPSVPEIIPESCTVCWDSAIVRWSSVCPAAAESFTLQYCRQSALEGEGLRSISGIRKCEQSVLLQPNENYLFYISAVNFAGASEQSEAALISTTGTRFHLLKDTASPGLVLCKDNIVRYPEEAFNRNTAPDECPGILGELLPPRGLHYWETTVEGSEGYRIGVAYHTTLGYSQLGENSTSWCIHCIPTSTSQRYELLHNSMQTSIITGEAPARMGVLLDYLHGCVSFFNAQSGQLLGSCCHRFSEPCHPALVLERPGTLALSLLTEVPDFAKHC